MTGGFDVLNGMKLLENSTLTLPGPDVLTKFEAPLAWRKRLLSWPWRPWVKTLKWECMLPTRVPDPQCYQTDGVLIGHPATIERIRKAMKETT